MRKRRWRKMSRGSAVMCLVFASTAFGAELKQATLDAWERYLHAADARMEERTRGQFLWADETQERVSRLRAGEVVVAQIGQKPEAVPAGLIHHWIGAAFVAGARMDDVMAVVRDYERYTEYYKP